MTCLFQSRSSGSSRESWGWKDPTPMWSLRIEVSERAIGLVWVVTCCWYALYACFVAATRKDDGSGVEETYFMTLTMNWTLVSYTTAYDLHPSLTGHFIVDILPE